MKRLLPAIAVAVAISLAACNQPKVIKIGFIGPLTGDAASIGQDMLNGTKWAINDINAKGGIKGMMVELVAEDGRCTGSDAASAAQKLVNVDKVQVIVGGLCSGETLAAAPIAEAAKVVMLSPGSSSPDVTKAGAYIFRNYPSDALKTTAMAKYFKEQKYMKVAMISENTDFAQAFRTALKAKVASGSVVFDEVTEPGSKDFRALFTRLKDTPFDVFFGNPNADAVLAVMVQQFREQGFTQPIITHDVGESLSIPQIAGKAAEKMRLINVPAAGEGGEFETKYKAAFGAPQASITWVAYAYDATNLYLQALEAVGNDGTKVKDYLDALTSYTGIVGTISFDDNGDVLGIPYALKEFQSGAIVKVKDISVE